MLESADLALDRARSLRKQYSGGPVLAEVIAEFAANVLEDFAQRLTVRADAIDSGERKLRPRGD